MCGVGVGEDPPGVSVPAGVSVPDGAGGVVLGTSLLAGGGPPGGESCLSSPVGLSVIRLLHPLSSTLSIIFSLSHLTMKKAFPASVGYFTSPFIH